jgi:hypothetical protein
MVVQSCCLSELVEDPRKYLYELKPEDDLLAWVLLVNTWIFRKLWKVALGVKARIIKEIGRK